ncbi:MAG: transporter [Usitatibacter sp.]
MDCFRASWLAAALCGYASNASASCGAAFCIVNTDWSAQGAWVEPGARFDLRFETITLDQPRHGTERVGVGEIPRDHDEVETKNRNWVAGVDWGFAPNWSVAASIPYVDRDHFHIHNNDQGGKQDERWSFRAVGDARVIGRYEFLSMSDPAAPRSAGVTFGVKLPTGKHDVANADGELAERTLQPGTGTTDALLGAYWHGMAPLSGFSWFARAQAVLPMNSRADYKPGRSLQLDGGLRYAASANVGFMLQANFQVKGRDSGANAEPEDSGQRGLYLSPGISWDVARDAQLYAYVQVPVHQAVNGVQLTADWSALAGVSWRF